MRLMARICRAEACGTARRTKQRWRITRAFGGHSLNAGRCRGPVVDAMHCEDPVLFLVPKHMFWAERESAEPIRAIPLGKARKRQAGSDVTLMPGATRWRKRLRRFNRLKRSEHRAD